MSMLVKIHLNRFHLKGCLLALSMVSLAPCTSSSLSDNETSKSLRPAIMEKAPDDKLGAPPIVSLKDLADSIEHNGKQRAYEKELSIQAKPLSLGKAPITKANVGYSLESNGESDLAMPLSSPPLSALISVDSKLDRYGLEAEFSQELSLKEALIGAAAGNLSILRSIASVRNQKWRLLNAYSSFLPSIGLNFYEIGLNSTTNIPIISVARSSTSGLGAGLTGGSSASRLGSSNSSTVTSTAEVLSTAVKTPLTIVNSGFSWKPIEGGRLLFTVMAEKHRAKAYKAQLVGNISDTLLKCAQDYYKLIQNDAILQIRTTAVATSAEQVRQNLALKSGGLATNLDVLQSKTQLAKDRQQLVNQQKARRIAATELAHLLNANLGQDLIATDKVLRKVRLVSKNLRINDLLRIALDNRPELKQYEELRQVAKKEILIATSPLLPSASLSGNVYGIESKIGRMQPTYLLTFGASWNFDGLGTTGVTNIQAAKWHARQSLLDANEKFTDVFQEVHNAYVDTFTSESAINEANSAVDSAAEELELARVRLNAGLGTNLDVLTAQRDLTEAKINKAQAIISFNNAQVQLLHDIGLTSIDNLVSGKMISVPPTR